MRLVRVLAFLPLLAGAVVSLSGCLGSGARPVSGDRAAIAETEYDLARDIWLRKRDPREALDHALKAADLDPHNADATHLVALLYLDFCSRKGELCRLDEAEKYARQTLKTAPDYREARNTLGVVLIHRQQYAEAVEVLRPLTTDMLYSTPENAWGNLGWAYLEMGQIREAIDALERSVAAQPLFCVGNYRLGLAYEQAKDLPQAAEALSRAIETDDPGCRRLQVAYAARGRVLAALGDPAGAKADFERCVEIDHRSSTGQECGSMLPKLK